MTAEGRGDIDQHGMGRNEMLGEFDREIGRFCVGANVVIIQSEQVLRNCFA